MVPPLQYIALPFTRTSFIRPAAAACFSSFVIENQSPQVAACSRSFRKRADLGTSLAGPCYMYGKRVSFRPMPEEALFVCPVFYRNPQRMLATNCIIDSYVSDAFKETCRRDGVTKRYPIPRSAFNYIILHFNYIIWHRNDTIKRKDEVIPVPFFQCALISSIARVLWQADSTGSFDTSIGTMDPSADARNRSSWPCPRIRQRFFVTARFFRKLIQALL